MLAPAAVREVQASPREERSQNADGSDREREFQTAIENPPSYVVSL